MADEQKLSRYDRAKIDATKAATRAAAEVIKDLSDRVKSLTERLDEEGGPTMSLDELTQVAREEMAAALATKPANQTNPPADQQEGQRPN